MKKLFLLLICALFAFVGCEQMADGTGDVEQPVFVANTEGSFIVPANGATIEVEVSTNIEYTVSIPQSALSWISHTDTRSVRDDVLVFTVAKNNVAQPRTATVEILGADGLVLTNVVFEQKAAVVVDSSEILLSVDKTVVEVGAVLTFTVTEASGADLTALATIYNGNDYTTVKRAKYQTSSEGVISFFATYNGKTSNIVKVTVGDGTGESTPTEGSAFLHKALLIDHTGVNCGYCPSAVDNLRYLESKTSWGPYYNEVTCHAGSYASGDPARSEAATALNSYQGNNGLINGYPSIVINFYSRVSHYDYEKIANVLQNVVKKAGADVGISLSVEKGSSKVICSAQIKAAVSNEYKVNAWLLENNIYSPNQNGAKKDYHYYYNHALRKTSETFNAVDISGKSIGMLYMNQTYDYNCEIAVDSSWVMNNLEVLIVVTARNGSNQWEVVNTAVCGVGETTPFAYVQ
ncbi:MAG: Omp28-related outer membrane protein [Alistipes sp.]|nr:Omp28-related outer membrane protein [Alistipes sp.]